MWKHLLFKFFNELNCSEFILRRQLNPCYYTFSFSSSTVISSDFSASLSFCPLTPPLVLCSYSLTSSSLPSLFPLVCTYLIGWVGSVRRALCSGDNCSHLKWRLQSKPEGEQQSKEHAWNNTEYRGYCAVPKHQGHCYAMLSLEYVYKIVNEKTNRDIFYFSDTRGKTSGKKMLCLACGLTVHQVKD